MPNRRLILKFLLGGCSTFLPTLKAYSQPPSGFVTTIVCPYPPGATTDLISRLFASELTALTNTEFIVINKSGAGGNSGSKYVAHSRPDGKTILMGAVGPLTVNEFLYPHLGFNPEKDFLPIALVLSVPLVLVAHRNFPANNLGELITLIQNEPNKYTYASSGNGTPQHLAATILQNLTHTHLVHIPYKGGGPAMLDVIGGNVDLMFAGTTEALSHIRQNEVKVLGVTSKHRISELPNTQTFDEVGIHEDISAWYGFVVPSKTPENTIKSLSRDFKLVLERDPIRARLNALGAEKIDSSPEYFQKLMEVERARWKRLIRTNSVTPD